MEQRLRESRCATPDCGKKIKYVSGWNYGRWLHEKTGDWRCAGWRADPNRQARPPMEYYQRQTS